MTIHHHIDVSNTALTNRRNTVHNNAVSSGFKPSLKLEKLYWNLIVTYVNLQCNKVKRKLIWLVYVLDKLVCLSDRFVWRKWRTSSLRWLSLVFTKLITKVPPPVRVSYTRGFSAATEMEVGSPVPNCTLTRSWGALRTGSWRTTPEPWTHCWSSFTKMMGTLVKSHCFTAADWQL